MQFYEKLNFLMSITNTSNSVLGQKIKLDPSYISRLRRGKRNPLKDETIISAMAEYFARHCIAEYQLKAVFDTLKINKNVLNNIELSTVITKWLSDEKSNEIKAVGGFMDGLLELNTTKMPDKLPQITKQLNTPTIFPKDDVSIYYGLKGKRQAAEYFLQEVINQGEPTTLLLYSDESTEWMTGNPEFASKWAQLMIGVLSKGNKIKIIHTISRDLDEMLNALHQWMPLYMTGLIEPYYYPKKRDGVFKQTLFIALGISAVISTSVGSSIDYEANLLIRNNNAIMAYTEVFNQYLNQCKPLMRVFTAKDKELYLETLIEFEKENSNTIMKTESLSLLTMPKKVSLEILTRIGVKSSNIIDYQIQRILIFEEYLLTNTFTEIIPILDFKTIKDGKVKVSFSDMMNGSRIYYTQDEYIQHLDHLVYLLETYENFHIKLIDQMPETNHTIYAKEDIGAIIAKTSVPSVVLAVNETNMTAAFWDFLKHMIGEKGYQRQSNVEDIKRLKEYIKRILIFS